MYSVALELLGSTVPTTAAVCVGCIKVLIGATMGGMTPGHTLVVAATVSDVLLSTSIGTYIY